MDFIVYSTPRSGSYWLSRFLNYNSLSCGHDELMYFRDMTDAKSYLSIPNNGTVETGLAPYWRLVPADTKTVILRRNISDICKSMNKLGYETNDEFIRRMNYLDKKLYQIEKRVQNCLVIDYEDLFLEENCKKVFEFCLDIPFDKQWYDNMVKLNLQTNMNKTFLYVKAYEKQLIKMNNIAKQQTLQLINKPANEIDGITIREENLTSWKNEKFVKYQHFAVINENPEQVDQELSWDTMKILEDAGCLQTIIARSNGRAFGYLISTIGNSIRFDGILRGEHGAFFADEGFKGLGTAMIKEADKLLIAKGIKEIQYYAGTHESHDKLEHIYQKLGAHPYGSMFVRRV